MTTVDDLDISAECAAELKRLARLRQRDDPYGIALAEQVVDFLRDYRDRDIRREGAGLERSREKFSSAHRRVRIPARHFS